MAFSAQIFGPNTGISIANRKEAATLGVKAASQGRGGDKYSIKATPFTANLLRNMGGSSSFSPETGEMEFFFGYDSIGDMFDGGGPGASSPDQNNKSYDNDNIAGNEVTGIAAASNRAAGNAATNAATGNDSDDRVVNVPEVPQDMGASWKPDWMDGGGKGKSGSTFSTEGFFTPTNNYVDPYGDESETGGVNNDGMGGADGQGNAGNFISNISNTLGGNWRDSEDYYDGGGTGKSGDYFIGGGLAGAVGNLMGGPKGGDNEGNVKTGRLSDDVRALVSTPEAKNKGLKADDDYVTYTNGVNYSGQIGEQYFVNGKPVSSLADFQEGMNQGGDDTPNQRYARYRNYNAPPATSGGGSAPTDDYSIRYNEMEPSEATAAINAEITALQTQIDAISNSESGEDTSVIEAEIASLREQLLTYGVSVEDTSGVTMVDPSSGGGFVRRPVIDRETGETRYVEVPLSVDSGQDNFRNERRSGFGSTLYA